MMQWKKIAGIWIAIYFVIGMVTYITGIDKLNILTPIALLLLLFIIRTEIPVRSVWAFGFSILLNAIGTLPIYLGGKTFTLYSLQNYDLLVHFFGFFFFTLGVILIYFKGRVPAKAILPLLLAMLGVGAMIEITEYIGYVYLDYGNGWLQFGDGDSDPGFGPWEDSMTDMMSNIMGIMCVIIVYNIFKKSISDPG